MQYFKNFSEAYEDLQNIKPLEKDLTQEQNIDDVVETVQQVMLNILRASKLNLTQEDVSVYSFMLKRLGMTTYNEANPCFKEHPRTDMSTLANFKNNIEAPLGVFTQLIDTDYETATFGLSYAFDSNYIPNWIQTQEEYKAEIEASSLKHFKTFDDIMADLKTIQPLEKDLSQSSDLNEVLPTIKRTMIHFLEASKYNFTQDEYKQYVEALRNLGLKTYSESNDYFKHSNASLEDYIDAKDDITYPLSVFTQILDYDYDNFKFAMGMFADNTDHSWMSQWLNAQDVKYGKFADFKEQYKFDIEYNKNKAEKGLTGKFKYFTNFEDILKDLKTIKPLKYSMDSENVEFKDVYPTLERVMINLKSCKNYHFTEEESQKYSDELRKLGFVRFKELSESIKVKRPLDDEENYTKNDIIAPLKMISQLLSDNVYRIQGGLDVFNMREEDSYVSRWLTAQGIEPENYSAFIEMYNDVYNKEELEEIKPKVENKEKEEDGLEM